MFEFAVKYHSTKAIHAIAKAHGRSSFGIRLKVIPSHKVLLASHRTQPSGQKTSQLIWRPKP